MLVAELCVCFMNHDHIWNIRGINDHVKWPTLRSKLEESNAAIVCFQETKKILL